MIILCSLLSFLDNISYFIQEIQDISLTAFFPLCLNCSLKLVAKTTDSIAVLSCKVHSVNLLLVMCLALEIDFNNWYQFLKADLKAFWEQSSQ